MKNTDHEPTGNISNALEGNAIETRQPSKLAGQCPRIHEIDCDTGSNWRRTESFTAFVQNTILLQRLSTTIIGNNNHWSTQ